MTFATSSLSWWRPQSFRKGWTWGLCVNWNVLSEWNSNLWREFNCAHKREVVNVSDIHSDIGLRPERFASWLAPSLGFYICNAPFIEWQWRDDGPIIALRISARFPPERDHAKWISVRQAFNELAEIFAIRCRTLAYVTMMWVAASIKSHRWRWIMPAELIVFWFQATSEKTNFKQRGRFDQMTIPSARFNIFNARTKGGASPSPSFV